MVYTEQVFKPFEVGEISCRYFGKPLDTWSITAGVPLELRGRRVLAKFCATPYFLRRKNTVCLSNPELGYRITEEDLATYKTRAAKLGMSKWDEFIVPDKASLLLMATIGVSGPESTAPSRLRLHLYSPGGRFQSSAYEIIPDRTLSFYYFHPLDTRPLASSGDDLVPNGVRLSIPIINDTESLENLIKRLEDIAARFAFQ